MKKLPIHRRPFFAKRILEVGGGHDPYAGVTHAVDKFPDNDSQRAGAMLLARGVEFKKGDLESIPFEANPKFDFVYLSHVLEHAENPERAVAELVRVANAGYVETPSPLREQIAAPMPYDPNDFHLHFIWKSTRAENTLAYIRKNSATLGEFPDHPEASLAKKLADLARAKSLDVEPLLPRDAKTTKIYFSGTLKIIHYDSFAEAYRQGDNPYASASYVERATRFPGFLRSRRFRKLAELLR
jgi:SAM-dependent methyltransferase